MPEDVREVQGESPQETQGSERTMGTLIMSQCFFRLPTFSKSVNVEVIRPAEGASTDELEKFWGMRFRQGGSAAQGAEREREEEERKRERRERGPKSERGGQGKDDEGEKREEAARPRRVPGLGREAFWSGDQINASLSVFDRDAIVRVSIGGPEDTTEKVKRASALARKILRQL
jgi:hypothetical protein